MLLRRARWVLSRLRCNGHSLLLSSYLTRIGRIENPSWNACGHLPSHSGLSSYGLFVLLAFWRLSVSLRPLVQTLRSCPASGAPWSSAMPPFLKSGRVATTTQRTMQSGNRNSTPNSIPNSFQGFWHATIPHSSYSGFDN